MFVDAAERGGQLDGKNDPVAFEPRTGQSHILGERLGSGALDLENAFFEGLPVLRPTEGSPLETDVVLQAMERAGGIAPQTDGRVRVLR